MRSELLEICPKRHQAWFNAAILIHLYCATLCSSSHVHNVNTFDKPRTSGITYLYGNRTCINCPPGTYLVGPCDQPFNKSNCNTCPEGTFQSHRTRAGRCEPCDSQCLHDEHMVVVKNCTTTRNILCQCMDGYYKHTVRYADVHTCLKYTECKEGQIVIKKGTPSSDQVCANCSMDQYFHDGMCTLCSRCNFTVIQKCTRFNDTICRYASGNETRTTDLSKTQGGQFLVILGLLIFGSVILIAGPIAILYKCLNVKPSDNKNVRYQCNKPLLPKKQPTAQNTPYLRTSTPLYTELKDPGTWTNEVFSFISKNLPGNWKMFIRELPGYNEDIETRLERISVEERDNISEQIHTALREWKQNHEWPNLSVNSILDALEAHENSGRLKNDICDIANRLAEEQMKANMRIANE